MELTIRSNDMIDVSVSMLDSSSKELIKLREIMIEQCDRISAVLTEMSGYTDFDVQLKKLYELKKKLEEDAYNVFRLGRVLELCTDCYKKTEDTVVDLSENYNTSKINRNVLEQDFTPNPDFMVIV